MMFSKSDLSLKTLSTLKSLRHCGEAIACLPLFAMVTTTLNSPSAALAYGAQLSYLGFLGAAIYRGARSIPICRGLEQLSAAIKKGKDTSALDPTKDPVLAVVLDIVKRYSREDELVDCTTLLEGAHGALRPIDPLNQHLNAMREQTGAASTYLNSIGHRDAQEAERYASAIRSLHELTRSKVERDSSGRIINRGVISVAQVTNHFEQQRSPDIEPEHSLDSTLKCDMSQQGTSRSPPHSNHIQQPVDMGLDEALAAVRARDSPLLQSGSLLRDDSEPTR